MTALRLVPAVILAAAALLSGCKSREAEPRIEKQRPNAIRDYIVEPKDRAAGAAKAVQEHNRRMAAGLEE